MARITFFIYCFFSFFIISGHSQEIVFNKELYALHYGQHNGLSTNGIYDLVQDDKGFLYLATGKGLFRYDGFSFQSMNENVDNYMGGSALSVFKKDHIFFESFDGYVYQFHQKKWKSFNVNKPVHFLKYGIYQDTLFVVQKQGVDIYNITNHKYLRTVKFKIGAPQHTIQVGPNYFMINEDYLIKSNSRNLLAQFSIENISPTKTIRQIYHHQNKLYVVGRSTHQEGVWVFDLNLNFLYKIDVNEIDGIVQHIDFIDEKAWVSTNKGILTYQNPNGKWKFQEKLFNGQNISRVIKGKNSEYWISVIGKGLYLVPNPKQYVYSIADESINRIINSAEGYLIGTTLGNVYKLNKNFSSSRFVLQTEMKTPIFYLYENQQNKDLFYVPSLGFYHVSQNRSQFYDLALKSVADIDDKYYALATSSHLLLYAKKEYPKHKTSAWDSLFHQKKDKNGFAYLMDGLRSKTVCYDPKKQKIYALTNAGLFVVNRNGAINELSSNNQPIIADQMQVADNKIFYLTYSGEINVLSAGKTEKLNIDSRVLDFKLFESSLTLKTNNGFVIYDIHKKNLKYISFKCDPASIGDFSVKDNKLIVLMSTGLTEVMIEPEINQHQPLNFIIENIKIAGEHENIEHFRKKLPYHLNSLEINYAILDYTYAPSYSLYYRVNNRDWEKLPANSRKLQFHQLSSGKYIIQFKLNDKELKEQVTFEIENPYWETWWFYILISIATLTILSFYYRQHRKKLQAKIKLLEEKVILEKKLGQSLLTSIKAQMNPHFYFNALNSIQAFIYKNDKEHALEYLTKFSKLTRNILAQTDMEDITLEEEIATLKLYLDLEKVRFSNRFLYSIEYANEINIATVHIPAMLIQPYVENAVKHGFTKLTNNGLIKILFEAKEQYLHVTIEDNGVGRAQAETLKKNNLEPSFSSEANKRRLEILNANNSNKVSVVYEDLLNNAGTASGTRVKICIPINIKKSSYSKVH